MTYDSIDEAARAMEPSAFATYDRGHIVRNQFEETAFLNAQKTVRTAKRKAKAAITTYLQSLLAQGPSEEALNAAFEGWAQPPATSMMYGNARTLQHGKQAFEAYLKAELERLGG